MDWVEGKQGLNAFWGSTTDVKYEIRKMKQDYKKAYNILMDYWDSFPDEEKEEINKQLNAVGL